MNFFSFVRKVNYRYLRILVKLVSVYNNILQVIWWLNNLFEDFLEILKRKKSQSKREKKRALQKTPAKDAKKCKNSDMFKTKESFQLFSRFFRDGM